MSFRWVGAVTPTVVAALRGAMLKPAEANVHPLSGFETAGTDLHALEAAAWAHAMAGEVERAARRLVALLAPEHIEREELPDAELLLRDSRHLARSALAAAHTATGDLAAAASALAIAMRQPTEFAELHRSAREAIARAAPTSSAELDGDTLPSA